MRSTSKKLSQRRNGEDAPGRDLTWLMLTTRRHSKCPCGWCSILPGHLSSHGEGLRGNHAHSLERFVSWVVKNLPANEGDIGDAGWIPGSGRSPGGGYSNPLQYSCLENSIDRRAWWATFHRVTKSQIHLKRLSTHARPGSIGPYG